MAVEGTEGNFYEKVQAALSIQRKPCRSLARICFRRYFAHLIYLRNDDSRTCWCVRARWDVPGKMRREPKSWISSSIARRSLSYSKILFYYSARSSSWTFIMLLWDEKESKEIEFNKKIMFNLIVCVLGDLLARKSLQQVLFVIIMIDVPSSLDVWWKLANMYNAIIPMTLLNSYRI